MAYRKIEKQGYTLYENENGPTLGTALNRVIEQDGMVFRDLCGTGSCSPLRTGGFPMTSELGTWPLGCPWRRLRG